MNEPGRTVSDTGEFGIIARAREVFGEAPAGEVWAGDDAAVIELEGASVLLSTDVIVQDIDFDLSFSTGEDVGWKALAVNASDIAAMGGQPTHAVATLCIQADAPLDLVSSILEGMRAASTEWGLAVVGGDISEATILSVGVSMLGRASAEGPMLRSGARPGNALCVTGSLGGAAAGLEILRHGLLDGATSGRAELEAAANRHLRPRAQLEAGRIIAFSGARAAIDVSDGLAADLAHITQEQGLGCEVDPDLVPEDPAVGLVARALGGWDPRGAVLAGGDDFELLFAIAERRVDETVSALAERGLDCTRIGTVTDDGCKIGNEPLETWRRLGWEHLRNR